LHFPFQEGFFILDAAPAFLEVGVTDFRLALPIPGGRQNICFVSESLEGSLEGVEPEGGQRGEFFQEPGKTEVEQPPQKERPEFSVLTEEIKEDVDVPANDLFYGSPFLISQDLSSADLRAGRESLLGCRSDGMSENEREAVRWNAGPNPEQDGRGGEGEMMQVKSLASQRFRVSTRAPQKPEGDSEHFGVELHNLGQRCQRRRIGREGLCSLSAFDKERKFRRNARPPVRDTPLGGSLGKGRDIRSLG
jgi:hypothetical protein